MSKINICTRVLPPYFILPPHCATLEGAVTTTLCPRTKRAALLQRISPPPGTWRSIAEKWGDRYGRDGGLEQTNTHATCLSAYAAGLPCSPGARSREWSSFVCMAERPNQSKHVLSRRSPPRTLRRSRWRLCPGFLRSVPFYSAVSFCCSRESGHGRLSRMHRRMSATRVPVHVPFTGIAGAQTHRA